MKNSKQGVDSNQVPNSPSQGWNKTVAHLFKNSTIQNQQDLERILDNVNPDIQPKIMLESIVNQNNNLVSSVNESYILSSELNEKMNQEIMNIDSNFAKIKIPSGGKGSFGPISDPFLNELERKKKELENTKFSNESQTSKDKDEIQTLENKKKDHMEKLRNISVEKKVWLDQLDEQDLQKLTYSSHFNSEHDYDYKILFLIFEGVFLEKVQERIDQQLALVGTANGWHVLNEEEEERQRQIREAEKLSFEDLPADQKASKEKKWMEREEVLNHELSGKKKAVMEEWQAYFCKFWGVRDIYDKSKNARESGLFNQVNYDLYVKITKETIFGIFKKMCFNAWQFKNIFLSCEELILMDQFKRYLLKFSERQVADSKQEEEALGILMKIINNLKDIAEVQTIGPNDRDEVVQKSKEKNITLGTAINDLNLIRKEMKEKPIRRVEVPYFTKVFLPMMLTIRTITFLTIGNKRVKAFTDSITTLNNKIKKRSADNSAIDGQVKLLLEVKSGMDRQNPDKIDNSNIVISEQDVVLKESDSDYNKTVSALTEIKKSLNSLKTLKNEIENCNNNMIKAISKNLIKPDTFAS